MPSAALEAAIAVYRDRLPTVVLADGTDYVVCLSTDPLPTPQDVESLDALWTTHCTLLDGRDDGRVVAIAHPDTAPDVARSMGWRGAHVDHHEVLEDGRVLLYSLGARAHGY